MAADTPIPERSVLVICQLVGLEALRARVPAALKRTVDGLNRALDELAAEMDGVRVRSPAVGVLTIWSDVEKAVSFSVRLQREILERDWPTTLLLRPEAGELRAPDGTLLYRGPRVRTVVHAGRIERVERTDGPDVVGGPALYQLARVLATVHGGQTVVTSEAWRLLQHPPQDAAVTELGTHTLIGYQGNAELVQLVPAELSQRRFPPPATRDVARSNAPTPRPGFVGRDGDLQAISELASFGLRVVSLNGPPGVGKSALLRRYVAVHGGAFTGRDGGGAWVCTVEGRTPAHVILAVAANLGLTLRFGRDREELLRQVGAVLRRRGPTLLAIDGVQAEPEALEDCLRSMLHSAPELRLLVACRRRMGLPGEIAYQLEPFARVGTEGVRNADAVRLFVDRATRANPRWQPSDPERIASVVNLLGGSPLAISLVAGLASTLDLEAIATELEPLEPGLDSVVDLVWSRLDPAERHVLSSCSVYPAGFDRLGAEAVVDAESTGIDSAEVLQRLLRWGLVLRNEDPRTPEVRRFRVDRHVRKRALAELELEQRRVLERRAAGRLLAQCEPWAVRAWGADGGAVLARLAVEWASLTGIAMRAARPDSEPDDVDLGLRACAALWPLVATQGPAGLFLELVTPVLERADVVLGADPLLQVRAMAARAGARRNIGDLSGAQADAERGAEVARRWGDGPGEGHCTMVLGLVHHGRGRLEAARDTLRRATELLFLEEPGFSAVARGALGVVLGDLGAFDEADRALDEARRVLQELGWHRYLGLQLTSLGLLRRRQDRLDEARALYSESAELHRRLGARRSLAVCLVNLASLDLRDERVVTAREVLAEALEAAQETGDRVAESRVHGNLALAFLSDGAIDSAREHLLAALAIDRDLRARVAEAQDMIYVGIAHQLVGNLSGARESYERALPMLEERAPPRHAAVARAWLGALNVEEHRPADALACFALAREAAERSGEAALQRSVTVLQATTSLLKGVGDDPTHAREVLERSAGWKDIEVRIARRRLEELLRTGLTTD